MIIGVASFPVETLSYQRSNATHRHFRPSVMTDGGRTRATRDRGS